jgi:cytochrome c2
MEHTSESGRRGIKEEIDEEKRKVQTLQLVSLDGSGKSQEAEFTYPELEQEFKDLQAEKARLLAEKAELVRPLSETRRKRDAYLQNHLNGLTATQLKGLLVKAQTAPLRIRQINNPDAGIVDRCESCHLGIREPVVLNQEDMGGEAAFTSHPRLELLRIHDPERFGCTPCHNGNGMQVQSASTAHGLYKHWLWPLHPPENFEAGCQQCHARDMVLDHAAVLTQGKNLFYYRGCQGCHRFQGYDPEPEELLSVQQSIVQLENERSEAEREIERSIQAGDEAPDNETARKMYARADELRVSISNIDARFEQLDFRSRNLLKEIKRIGPALKEVRVKLRPEWIPVWVQNPHEFRPSTRMPQFRLTDEEVRAVSAFIWQSGIDAQLTAQPRGDVAKGKESFETRGCMGCHSVGEGDARVGGSFAANLTRVGEKANYDYLVRWIHNPRDRTSPYCPYEERDLTPEDYAKHGLPFVFDLEHSECPNDGHALQVEQMTVMPSLRLSWEESRNIASYLMTLKSQDAGSYPGAEFLNDPELKDRGKAVAFRYGCAACHEIAGLENAGRIGTELTEEGSKPLDQVDFAMFKSQAKREGWFNHKGFFERKLQKPEMFDEGLIRPPEERLRMPNLHLKPEEVTALTTFLMGSVDSELPERYFYEPEDYRRDIQEGWWLVRKYNCMGCHQFKMDEPADLMKMARYQTPEGRDQLPPRLLSEGARVSPHWLARFLANPAMSESNKDRNGVRTYLKARMPTFHFSLGEVGTLVRFFQALNSQPMPYLPLEIEPLSPRELTMARALFTSRAAPCLKCHATGTPSHDRFATAPNFLLAGERLKPGWTRRWLLDPSMIDPGTAMPTGLFKRDGDRWVFAGPTPSIFAGYQEDHADLLVRYMFQITPEEQRRLVGMGGAAPGVASRTGGDDGAPSRAALSGTLMKAH